MRHDRHLSVAAAAAVFLGCAWFSQEILEVDWLRWIFLAAAGLVSVCWSLLILRWLAEALVKALRDLPAIAKTGGFSLLRKSGDAPPPARPTTRTGRVLGVLASGGFSLLRDPAAAERHSPSPP